MNRHELAKALGVHITTVKDWLSKGLPVEEDGSYDLGKVRTWHAQNMKRVLPRLGGQPRLQGPRKDSTREIAKKLAKDAAPVDPTAPVLTPEQQEAKLLDLRYARARAEKAELEMSRLRGEVVPRVDLEERDIRQVSEVRRGLMGMGKRIAPLVLGVPTAREIQAIIDKECYHVLERFARRDDEEPPPKKRKA